MSLDVLVDLEKLLDSKSLETWSYRHLPTPTAIFPAIINSEEEDFETDYLRTHEEGAKRPTFKNEGAQRSDGFLQSNNAAIESVDKQVRALRKKLQQIELLEEKRSKGHLLDNQQIAKLQNRPVLESSLTELGAPMDTVHLNVCSQVDLNVCSQVEEINGKRAVSRKQRRKNKKNPAHEDDESSDFAIGAEFGIKKGFMDGEDTEDSNKEKAAGCKTDIETQETNTSPFYNKKALGDATQKKTLSSKKKNRKGGLSMFLSGALDDVPKPAIPPPVKAKSEGPAWGGSKISQGSTSLRIIQNEQSKSEETKPARKKELNETSEGSTSSKFQMNSGLSSSPIPMTSTLKVHVPDGDKSASPWVASGTPPSLSRPSLRDIQLQQIKQLQQQGISISPKTRTTGFSVPIGPGSPSETGGLNRWFKPEIDAPSPIRSIQIEEKAIKDLKRFYSSVRIVKNQS